MSWSPHPDVGETRRVITEMFNVGGETTWLIELRDGGGPVGLCGWRRPQAQSVELRLLPRAAPGGGSGIMSEVVQLLLDEARRDPTAYRVYAYCHVDNTGSARVLERSGLPLEGRLVRYGMFPNISSEPQDCLLFAKALR